MFDEEMIDLFSQEIIDFVDVYLMTTSLTHGCLNPIVEKEKSIKFGVDKWNHYQHAIQKVARTKFFFVFQFHRDEKIFLDRLIDLLDGYIDYKVNNYSNYYGCSFTLNVGSKKNFLQMFEKLCPTNGG